MKTYYLAFYYYINRWRLINREVSTDKAYVLAVMAPYKKDYVTKLKTIRL